MTKIRRMAVEAALREVHRGREASVIFEQEVEALRALSAVLWSRDWSAEPARTFRGGAEASGEISNGVEL